MRDYDTVISRINAESLLAHSESPRRPDSPVERMQRIVDLLWEALHDEGVSWIGFYLDRPEEPDDRRLVLGPHRDKPACSPIGLHGACGQTLLSGKSLVVRDVRDLGEDYIACDPRDRSEIVIPLFDSAGTCFAVLDLDSFEVGAFDETDVEGLSAILRAAGFRPASNRKSGTGH